MTLLLSFFLFTGLGAADLSHYAESLLIDPISNYTFFWTADTVNQRLRVGISIQSIGWIGFGISSTGGMVGSDVFIAYFQNDSIILHDRKATDHILPGLDTDNGGTEDWNVVNGSQTNEITILEVERAFHTGDLQDLDFVSGTMSLVFAYGAQPVDGVYLQHINRFPMSFSLWGGVTKSSVLNTTGFPNDTQIFSIRQEQHTIMSSTEYYCLGAELVSAIAAQAIAFEPVVNNSAVLHHMLIYGCTSSHTSGVQPFECSSMPSGCTTVMWAWAVGGPPFVVTPEAGFPYGSAPFQHIVLQFHYDNSVGLPSPVDSSGVNIYYTHYLRPNDAAFLRLGYSLQYIDIPPRQFAYTTAALCPNSLIQYVPFDLQVFGSFLHMHKRGSQIWTEQWRNGQLFGTVGSNQNYDFSYQRIISLTTVITTADALTTYCTWNTMNESAPILGGETTSNEMCYNFLAYYPALPTTDEACEGYLFPMGTYTASNVATPYGSCINCPPGFVTSNGTSGVSGVSGVSGTSGRSGGSVASTGSHILPLYFMSSILMGMIFGFVF